MGKHGPCYHCGVTSTPLWRNGPPEKPVLCNACGSRWRTKGTLVNYTPLHARAEPVDYEDYRYPRVKSMPVKNREAKVLKRKQSNENPVAKEIRHDYNRGPLKAIDEETSNRSSSGSAISNSESCVQFGSADASDLTGPAQSVVWDQMVPSRKRTCINRTKQSPVEKLTKDLYTILHEQQSSRFSASSEEDLLFESDRPMVSVEIGHGSVLIRHPSSLTQEEESEASSLSVDNKAHLIKDSYPCLAGIPVHICKGGIEKNKRPSRQQEETNREKDEHEKLQILGNHNSLLCYVDLKEMINFDVFASHLTNEEQQQLLQFLPDLDTAILPYSLQSMFTSTEFEENLFSFQKLLGEGVFDLSFPGVKAEDCGTLKRLALCDSKKSKWMKQYSLLKDIKCTSGKKGSVSAGGINVLASGTSANVKRLCDAVIRNCPGTKMTMTNPKSRELVEHGSSCFSPRTLFSMPSDTNMDSFQYMDESYDQDLLLDVPSNSSFPEAELLYQASPSSSSVYPHLNRP